MEGFFNIFNIFNQKCSVDFKSLDLFFVLAFAECVELVQN